MIIKGEKKEDCEFFLGKIKELHSEILQKQSIIKQQKESETGMKEQENDLSEYETSSDEEFSKTKKS